MTSYVFSLQVDGKEISIEDRIISLKVTDSIANETDVLSLILHGTEELGIEKDSEVLVGVGIEGEPMYDLGRFVFHEKRSRPDRLMLNFRSISPINFKTKYERIWDNKPLNTILSEIANRSGLELILDTELLEIKISLNGSYTDKAVLTYILERTGAISKVRKNKFIVCRKENYEKIINEQLKTFLVDEASDYSYTEGVTLNYTGVKTWVYDTEKKDRIPIVIGDQTNPLEILPISQNLQSETVRAQNLLKQAKKESKKLLIHVHPTPKLNPIKVLAGSKIEVQKLEGIKGKWQVQKLEHQITPTKGLTTRLDCETI